MEQQALQNGTSSRNANQWRQVADFLDVQWLASMGLRRVARVSGMCGEAALAPREALPVGNTGITSLSELVFNCVN
ncbi:hypothetical protein [Rhodoferax ferrireducens]|uniref:hypothetical protein n=1 Tax=Rhodoferax ferrireducens TaxID=192843 RepID=UPI003BB7A95B